MTGMSMNRLVNSNSILEIMEIMEMEMCMSIPNNYKCNRTIKNNYKCKSTKKNFLHLSTKDNNHIRCKSNKNLISLPTTSTTNNNI